MADKPCPACGGIGLEENNLSQEQASVCPLCQGTSVVNTREVCACGLPAKRLAYRDKDVVMFCGADRCVKDAPVVDLRKEA